MNTHTMRDLGPDSAECAAPAPTRAERIAEIRERGTKTDGENRAELYANIRAAAKDIVRTIVENDGHIGGMLVILTPRVGSSLVVADIAGDPDNLEPVSCFAGSIMDEAAFGIIRRHMEHIIEKRVGLLRRTGR